MSKITFVNKVENSGSTNDGKVFAANMNEIKSVVNTNEDLRLGQTPTQGIYSSTLQSLVFKNSLNAAIFSISLADLVTGGGGISDAPADNLTYARKNNAWISFTAGIADAPNNSYSYARSGGGWVQISSGLSDAPADNNYYARRNNAWIAFTSGLADAPNNTKVYGRSGGGWVVISSGLADAPNNTNVYGRSGGNWVVISSGLADAPADNNYYARRNNTWIAFTSGITDAPVDSYTYARKDGAWVQISTGGSGGVTVHNDLTGRNQAACHPISSITDLQTTLSGKASLAGSTTQDFSAKTLTIATSMILNGRTLTVRTL